MSEKEEFPHVDIKPYLKDLKLWKTKEALVALTGLDSIEQAPFPGFDQSKTLTLDEVVGAHLILQPTFFNQMAELQLQEIDPRACQYIAEAFYKVLGAGGWLVVGSPMVGHLNMLQLISSFHRDWKAGKANIPGHWLFGESVEGKQSDVYVDAKDIYNLGVRMEACTFDKRHEESFALILYGDGKVKIDERPVPALIMNHFSHTDRVRLEMYIDMYQKTALQLCSSLQSFFGHLRGQPSIQAMAPLTLYEEFIHYVGNYARGSVGMGSAFGRTDNHNLKRSGEYLLEVLEGQRQRRKKLTEEVNRQATAEGQPAPKGDGSTG